ncbi:HAD family hydrolase [Actinomyces vulturis]|uniref:HAD family hydrolase n=1 Tax=Actinomyces vulturis TaxID=1857645 RepID=UPI00082DF774|nr:HAD family hydrolase [Actinomyces vulturis]
MTSTPPHGAQSFDASVPPTPFGGIPVSSPLKSAAYIDLDKTILAISTSYAMGAPMRRSGMITAGALVRAIVAQLPYLVRGADESHSSKLMTHLAAMSAGLPQERLTALIKETLHTAIEPAVYCEALEIIEAHKSAGQDVVIVSASLREMVEPIAALVGADRCVATELEVVDGLYTGRVAHSLLHGAKVEAISQDSQRFGIDLPHSFAYSDSISDLPMLEAVGHPVAVNPDKQLRSTAESRGWPVRDFERPVALKRPWSTPDAVGLRELTPHLPQSLPQVDRRVGHALRVGSLTAIAAASAWVVAGGVKFHRF